MTTAKSSLYSQLICHRHTNKPDLIWFDRPQIWFIWFLSNTMFHSLKAFIISVIDVSNYIVFGLMLIYSLVKKPVFKFYTFIIKFYFVITDTTWANHTCLVSIIENLKRSIVLLIETGWSENGSWRLSWSSFKWR